MYNDFWMSWHTQDLLNDPKTIDDIIQQLQGHVQKLEQMRAAGVTLVEEEEDGSVELHTDDPTVAANLGFCQYEVFLPRDECPECAVEIGEVHRLDCNCSECPNCGQMRLNCGLTRGEDRLPFTGYLAGEAEAEELGWYVRRVGDAEVVSCDADDPGAFLDTQRVLDQGRWDRDAECFVIDEQASRLKSKKESCECGR
jgi:hypothetical protein